MHKPLWVFGYGSLIWNPGFPVAESRIATLHGWHRSFCMLSIHHRGTVAKPGLVLALDAQAGASCAGVAYRVADGAEDETIKALRERELVSSAYLETWLSVSLPDGTEIPTLCYVIDPEHDQYCGGMSLERQAEMISSAIGGRGPNTEYLFNTSDHLAQLGIADADLMNLTRRVREITEKQHE